MELNKSETIVEQLRELKLKYNTVLADLETTRLANVRLETLVCNIQQEKTSIQQYFFSCTLDCLVLQNIRDASEQFAKPH